MLLKYFTNDSSIEKLRFCANPDAYNYFHDIEISDDGKVRMTDGEGQSFGGIIVGEYTVNIINDEEVKFSFFNLSVIDPYHSDFKILDLEPLEVIANKKKATLEFENSNKGTTTVYTTGYEFKPDPFILLHNNLEALSTYARKIFNQTEGFPTYDDDIFVGPYINNLETCFYLDIDKKINTEKQELDEIAIKEDSTEKQQDDSIFSKFLKKLVKMFK